MDNFNTYLAQILLEILEKDPRPMFGKKLDFKTIYSTPSLHDLKSAAIERYIADLGYQNVSDLADSLQKNFGIGSLSHWLTRKRLNRHVQMRNIIAHNGGVINRTYLMRSGATNQQLGETVHVAIAILASTYLAGLAEKLDVEAVTKYKLGE